MSDIIRDAIIKVSINVGDTADLKGLTTNITDLIKEQLEQIKSITTEIASIVGLTRTHLDYVKQVEEEYKRLDDIIDQMAEHESKAVVIAKEHASSVRQGSGVLDLLNKGWGALYTKASGLKAILAGASSFLTAATYTPALFGQVESIAKGLKAEFKGGDKAFDEGLFTAPGYKFLTTLGIMNKRPEDAERQMTDAMKQQVSMQKQYIDMIKAQTADEVSSRKEWIQALNEDKRSIDALIAVEKQKLDSAKAEYGLMNSRERESLQKIAATIGERGVGALSDDELTFIKSNSAFTAAIAEFAKKNADLQGFDEKISKPLGLENNLKLFQEQMTEKINMINNINLEIKDMTRLADDLTERLEPLMKDLLFRVTSRFRMDMDELARKIRNRDL